MGRCGGVGDPVRILHVITKGDVGGAQTHVVELAAAQRRGGHEVVVLAGCDGDAMARVRTAGVQVEIVPSLGRAVAPTADHAAVGDLGSAFRRIRPDIVHTHSSKGGLLGRIAARLEKIPSVYTAHGFPFQAGAPRLQRVLSFAGEWVGGHLGDAVICLTDSEAELARRSHVAPAESIVVIPNGLPDTLHVRTHRTSEVLRLLMVARFSPPKRQADLIRALSALSDLPWTLSFVGDGAHLAECEALAREVIPGRVEFLGHRDDVEELTATFDVALLWSGYEGMPISLMEAMRARLCCVASDLPGVRELFGKPPVGPLVATDRQLERELRELLVNPTAVDAGGAAARRRYESAFTIEHVLRGVDEVYDKVLTRRPR